MTLSHFLREVYIPSRPGLSAGYRKLLAATVSGLRAFAGRPLAAPDVDRHLLAAWISATIDGGCRPATANNRARMIRALLLAAYDDGLLDRPPRRTRRLPENHPPPEAWTIVECRRLMDYLTNLPGRVGHVSASDWWGSLCLTVYWSGCRIGAMLRVEASDYAQGTGLTVRKQKNGRQQWYPLPGACCEAIERVVGASGPIWRWPCHRNTLFSCFRRLVEAAGLPAPRTHCQLFHRLRRTTLSYCAAVDPAIAQRQADHADLRTTMRSYIDPRITRQRSAIDVLPDPLPPRRPRLRIVG